LVEAQESRKELTLLPAEFNEFWENNIFGRKLGLVLMESSREDILFSDPDILCFQSPSDLLTHLDATPSVPAYNRETVGTSYCAPKVSDLMATRGIRPLIGFNSGLMYIPKNYLDWELCRDCLAQYPGGRGHHFIEQGTFQALLSYAGAAPLSEVKYMLSCAGMYFWQKDIDYDSIIMRHFFGVVRHKMYTKGMPLLFEKIIRLN
jgi:hypothetical protein